MQNGQPGVAAPPKKTLCSTVSSPPIQSDPAKAASAMKLTKLLDNAAARQPIALSKANSYDPSQLRNLQRSMGKLKLTPKTSIDRVHHPKFLYHLVDRHAVVDAPVVFEARVEKIYTIEKVTWSHDGVELEESAEKDIKLLRVSSKDYTILSCVMGRFHPSFVGTITVTIENKYGKASSKCQCQIDFSKRSDLFEGEDSKVAGHRKLSSTVKISSNNGRLYNLDENSTVDAAQADGVSCQGYTSDVMTALEEENNIKSFQPKHRLSNTQQYLNGFLDKE